MMPPVGITAYASCEVPLRLPPAECRWQQAVQCRFWSFLTILSLNITVEQEAGDASTCESDQRNHTPKGGVGLVAGLGNIRNFRNQLVVELGKGSCLYYISISPKMQYITHSINQNDRKEVQHL